MVTRSLTRLGSAALDLLYPPRCALCDRHGAFLCDACRESLPRAEGRRCDVCWLPLRGSLCSACAEHPRWFKALRSPYVYEGGVRRLVHAFKFGGQSSLGRVLAADLVSTYEQHDLSVDVVAPVPLAPARRRQRGYNQASLLAREVAREIGVSFQNALLRVRDTAPQSQIAGTEERHQNVLGAFEVASSARPAGLRVLLIDDVATTCATLNECAETLVSSGAAAVFGLTTARAD